MAYRRALKGSAAQPQQQGGESDLVDAGHHGKDGGVGDERCVEPRLRQAPRQLLASMPRRSLRHNHLPQRQPPSETRIHTSSFPITSLQLDRTCGSWQLVASHLKGIQDRAVIMHVWGLVDCPPEGY